MLTPPSYRPQRRRRLSAAPGARRFARELSVRMRISASVLDAEHMSARPSVLAAVNAAASRVGSLPQGCACCGAELQAEVAIPITPVIEITYCRLCGWGLRAGWMAQE